MQLRGSGSRTIPSRASDAVAWPSTEIAEAATSLGETIAQPPKRKRRAITTEEREEHSYREKKRRQTLNDKFLTLARSLPTIADRKRLSKSIIIDGANRHLQIERQLLLESLPRLEALLAERDELLASLNAVRQITTSPQVHEDAFQKLFAVRDYVFGTFPHGFHPTGGDDVENISLDPDSVDSPPRDDVSQTDEGGSLPFADVSATIGVSSTVDNIPQDAAHPAPIIFLDRNSSQQTPKGEVFEQATSFRPVLNNTHSTGLGPVRSLDLARGTNYLQSGQQSSLSPQSYQEGLPRPLVSYYPAPTSPYTSNVFLPQLSGTPAIPGALPYYPYPHAAPPVLPPEMQYPVFPPSQWVTAPQHNLPNTSVSPVAGQMPLIQPSVVQLMPVTLPRQQSQQPHQPPGNSRDL